MTVNFSGAGVALCGPTTAFALPVPAIDALHAFCGVWLTMSSSLFVHAGRPLVESLSVLGNVILIELAVVLLAESFVTFRVNFSDFGLDFVPAFDGETEAVPVIEPAESWA